jgi:hypothetical protein
MSTTLVAVHRRGTTKDYYYDYNVDLEKGHVRGVYIDGYCCRLHKDYSALDYNPCRYAHG